MSFIFALCKIVLIFFLLDLTKQGQAFRCNSTTPTYNGTCQGDYCFNIENKIRGCANFYRMVGDGDIACGHMHILGAPRKVCLCVQGYCSKWDVANMPTQTLADVNCTDDTATAINGQCSPGPCYVSNDLKRHDNKSKSTMQTCLRDWFAVSNFKNTIIYEAPLLKGRPACLSDQDKFNCMCKDPACNQYAKPTLPPAKDDNFFNCHKMQCNPNSDKNCTKKYLGTEKCVGQMCYYLETHYDFQLDGRSYKDHYIIRDCLNYSFKNPIQRLTFLTRFEFGDKSHSNFYPCRSDLCNAKTKGASTFKSILSLTFASLLFLAFGF